MKILILSMHFYPENFKINAIASELAKKHDITVLTGKPNYPDGKLFDNYKIFSLDRETYNNVEILRVPIFLRGSKKAYFLILNYISFIISCLIFGPFLLKKKEFDNIIVFGTSPLIQGIPGILFKYLKSAKLNLWVLDLWPEDLVNTGYIKNKLILKINNYISKFLYYFSDKILVTSTKFCEHISNNYNKSSYFVPNPFDHTYYNTDNIKINPFNLYLPFKYDDKDIILTFAGNIGNNQAIDVIINACKILKKKNIKFLIFGSGSKINYYKELIASENIHNIYFMGHYPKEKVKLYFKISSALLITLNNIGSLPLTLPGKVSDYLIARKPIICSADGALSEFIQKINCGLVSPANNPNILAKNILFFSNLNQFKKNKMIENGYKYANEHLSISKISSEIVKLIL